MMGKEIKPSEQLETFLDFIDQCASRYNLAHSNMDREDKRLQDLLHEIELAPDRKAQDRASTKLRRSRKIRRENKDMVKLYEQIVQFFGEQSNRKVLDKMRQLLGRQRKEEEYLYSERTYKPRVER